MPATGKRVELSDALEDSPQTQAIIEDMEKSVNPMKEFTAQLKSGFQTLYNNQVRVSESLRTVGSVLDAVNEKSFGEKDPFMAEAMKQLGKYVSELHSWQDMLCTQIQTALVQQLDSFASNDLTRLTTLKEAFTIARTEHSQAITKYNKVSKKKETERSRFDANSELFSARRRFHQSSLQYYAELNSFSFKKKFAVLDPLLAFMHSQLAYFKMGHEILTDEVGKFLTSLNVEIQKVRSEHEQMMKQQIKKGDQLEQLSPQLCIPDPDPSDPFVEYQPANLHLTRKAGYLNTKTGPKSWDRMYFFTKDHLLYNQHPQQAPGVLLDLTATGVDASSGDLDDKRYVFHVMTLEQVMDETGQPRLQKRPMYFQAESAKSRDEWVATIINIVSRKKQSRLEARGAAPVKPDEPMKRERSDSDLVRMERERVRSFVQSVSSPNRKQQPNVPAPQKHLQPQQTMPGARPQQQRPKPPPPPTRGNSTVQQLLEMADTQSIPMPEGVGYEKIYSVRYLGTLEVNQKTGVSVVKDTIRRIIAARALKNLMTIYTVNMLVTHKHVSLQDQISKRITTQFKLKDISYCAKHPDNEKLFGVIARVMKDNTEKHVCYVFEAEGDYTGKTICQSIIEAIKVAVKVITGVQSTPQSPEESMPSFDLPSSHPQTVFNVPPPNQRPMPKSTSTGSFQSGALNFPEDDPSRATGPRLNESFNENEEQNLIDMSAEPQVPPPVVPPTQSFPPQQVPPQQFPPQQSLPPQVPPRQVPPRQVPPQQAPTGQQISSRPLPQVPPQTVPPAQQFNRDYEAMYSVPYSSGERAPPIPPYNPSGQQTQEQNLLDLTTTTPTQPASGPMASSPTNDITGLSNIQSATEQAQLLTAGPSPVGPAPIPQENTSSDMPPTQADDTDMGGAGSDYDPFGLDDILSAQRQQVPPTTASVPSNQQPTQHDDGTNDPFNQATATSNPFDNF